MSGFGPSLLTPQRRSGHLQTGDHSCLCKQWGACHILVVMLRIPCMVALASALSLSWFAHAVGALACMRVHLARMLGSRRPVFVLQFVCPFLIFASLTSWCTTEHRME